MTVDALPTGPRHEVTTRVGAYSWQFYATCSCGWISPAWADSHKAAWEGSVGHG